jgi:tyrosinase
VTLTARPRGRRVTARIEHRKNVTRLTAEELAKLRRAFKAAYDIADDRGYQYYAGWHGVPFGWCGGHSNDPFFLPWHRAYLYHFELALKDAIQDPSVTVPWWDWMNAGGIPAAFTDEEADGEKNPLASAPISPYSTAPEPGWPTETFRRPGANPLSAPPPLRIRRDWVYEPTSYTEFNRRLTLLHNNMHGWVGGTMGEIDWAAYDPLFWAHHTMVDRMWRIWQHRNPGARPPQEILDVPLQLGKRPMFTVSEVLDVKVLGYDYAAAAPSVPGTR